MWRIGQVVVDGEGYAMALDLRGFPVVEETGEWMVPEGYCPKCACPLNPGERECLDCILDMAVDAV
ncbi:MAG: hypothetical protein AB1441_09325 [Bacillota bacterium]